MSTATGLKAMNRQGCIRMGEALENAVKNIQEEFGVTVKIGSGRYDDLTCKFTIEFAVHSSEGTPLTSEVQDLEYFAKRDFPNEEGPFYGKRFTTWEGKTFELTGYKPRRRKYPYIAKNVSTGKSFKFPKNSIHFTK